MPDATADELYDRFKGAIESGAGDEDRRRRLMLKIGDALTEHGELPEGMQGLIDSVLAAWRSPRTPSPDALRRARVRVWQALDARNGGDSTAIRDRVDRSMRAALCLTEIAEPEELYENAGWAAEMLSAKPWPRHTRYF